MAQNPVGGLGWESGKVVSPREMEQAPQGSSTKPVRVQEAFGKNSQACGVSVQGQELDQMDLMGPFQLSIFYHSMISI